MKVALRMDFFSHWLDLILTFIFSSLKIGQGKLLLQAKVRVQYSRSCSQANLGTTTNMQSSAQPAKPAQEDE